MTAKTSFRLLIPSLTLLAVGVQAADVPAQTAAPAASDSPVAAQVAEPKSSEAPAATTSVTADAAVSPPEAAAPVPDVAPVFEAAPGEAVEDKPKISAQITPRVFFFDYFKVGSNTKTHFLERYDYREALSGDTRSGVYPDVDLSLIYGNLARDIFTLDRRGFGEHNHRGEARYNEEKIGASATYSHYRSATGGIEYLFSPNEVGPGGVVPSNPNPGPGGDFYTEFDDDSNRYDYHVDRTTYAAGLTLKPALLGGWGTISVDYQGYKRDGNKFAPFYLGSGVKNSNNGNSEGADLADDDRWRGINLGIDERMNKISLNLDAAPRDLFNVNYKISLEKFNNNSPDLTLLDSILTPAGISHSLDPSDSRAFNPFFYIPDTTLLSQSIQFSKNFDSQVLIAAGYSHASLSDDSTHPRFTTLFGGQTDSWEGKITTDSAFLNANWNLSPVLGVEGFIKYHQRDNDSTYPVAGVIDPTVTNQLVGPYIQAINSIDYGLAANWRPGIMNSTLTLGWHRLDRERDLIYGSIDPGQTLYKEDTLSDELYLKWIARPAMGWTVRVTPSYTWADSTGLVTEPEEAFKLKTLVSYAAPEGWLVSGFYDYRRLQNSNNTFTDGSSSGTPLTYTQDIDSTLHSAGVSLNVMPRDNINAFVNLFWVQNDLSSYLFQTSAARWSPGVTFDLIDEPNYKINTYSIGFGGDWQANDKLKLSGSYTYSRSKGNVASGTVLTALQDATGTVDSKIDNSLHSFLIGADYVINPKTTLRANYIFDYYDDNAYSLLTGGVHTLVVGVSFTF